MGRHYIHNFKPSKRILAELVKYMSNVEIALLFGVKNHKTIGEWTKNYKIDRPKTKKIPVIPEWVLDEVASEIRKFNKDKEADEIVVPNATECIVVPKSVFKKPKKKVQIRPVINTCDIPAFINSGQVMDWLYGGQKYAAWR